MELLSKLGVNWGLILAQIINFALLLGVLTFFVYKPFLKLLDERRERIRKAMEHAGKMEEERKEWEVLRQKKLREIDTEAGTMLDHARQEAETTRQDILTTANHEMEKILERGRRQLEEERSRVFSDLQRTLSSMIVRVAQTILQREFTPQDQSRILQSLEKDLPKILS